MDSITHRFFRKIDTETPDQASANGKRRNHHNDHLPNTAAGCRCSASLGLLKLGYGNLLDRWCLLSVVSIGWYVFSLYGFNLKPRLYPSPTRRRPALPVGKTAGPGWDALGPDGTGGNELFDGLRTARRALGCGVVGGQ